MGERDALARPAAARGSPRVDSPRACPRCPDGTELVDGVGALAESVCADCHGRLLPEPEAAALLFEQRGLTRHTVAIAPQVHERCPACAMRLSLVDIDLTSLLFCTGCGSAWLDEGALSTLTDARVEEVRAPPPVRATGAVAVVSRAVVDVERVVHAFARAGFRTAADARLIGRGHGLIVERAPRVDGNRLVAALGHHGIDAEAVDTAAIVLPPLVAARAARLTAEGLKYADGFVPYRDVVAAALGIVHVAKTRREPKKNLTLAGRTGRLLANRVQHQTPRREVMHDDEQLLDLVRGKGRVRITQSSIERAANVTAETALRTFARELLARIDHAPLAGDARALLVSERARLQRYGPREWENVVAWERWRALLPAT